MVPFDGLESVEQGVVTFVSMQDLDACESLTPSTDRAVVVGGGLIGVELVECLAFHGVDVTFLVREPFFWPMGVHREEGEMIASHIAAHDGVDLRLGEELSTIRTDASGRVSGVTTDKGNEISCQMLGIAIGVTPSVDWLEEATTPPEIERGIRADRGLETSLPDVFAAGDCAEIGADEPDARQTDDEPFVEQIWYSAERQGELAGRAMLGDEVEYERPIFYNSAKFMEIEYTTVGQVIGPPSDATSLYRQMPGESVSQRIVFEEETERVLGFNMIGSRWDHRMLEQWIADRRQLDWVLEHLASAQFDVEFGRVPIEQMNEERQSLDEREYRP
jgi:NAD(P)H-nitrite reductase large subunit